MTVAGQETLTTREEKERKFSQELDEIIENCHAHLDGMIDQMEATVVTTSDCTACSGPEGEDEDKKISMTSLIAPSDMTVHSHYNSFRTSMFNASSYASSLSSFSDDDEFKPLYISDDDENLEANKLSRRTSRVKSLNQAQKSLDEAIKLLAATITERVMMEAKSIAAKDHSTQSLDSAYNGSSASESVAESVSNGSTESKLDAPDLNEITDHIAHQIVTDAIQKAQDQILLHSSTGRTFGTFWDHNVQEVPAPQIQDGSLETIANQIVLNAIQTAKNQLSK